MSRRWWLLPVLALPVLALPAVPWLATAAAARHGVTIAHAGWCSPGVCLTGVARDGVTAGWVEIGWDRSVRAKDVAVDLATLRGLGEAGGGEAGGGASLSGWLTRVDVDGLQLTGAPLPLPPLSGQLWPTRALTGEGVTVEGDTVHATVPTPYGDVAVDVTRGDRGELAIEATCARCVVRSDALSPEPVHLPPTRARGTWTDGAFAGMLTVGEVPVAVVATREGESITAKIEAGGVPLAAAYAVLADIVPELDRARIDGALTITGTVGWPGPEVHLTPTVEGLSVEGVLPAGYEAGRFTWRTRSAEGDVVLRTGGEGTPSWTPLAELGELLPAAVIAAEDARFLFHPGYDLDGMLAAAADNEARGETWRGGSTLTQQLAKNLFLDGTRTYARKARELLYAVDLERSLGKRRILELYLNVVEWGPGIYGAREAAEAYFLKRPSGLLPEEAAWLASILPRPRSAWTSEYVRNRPNRERIRSILASMRSLPPEVREAAEARPIRFVPP